MMVSVIVRASSQSFNPDKFCHPTLTKAEWMNGVRLSIDTWTDTTCAGKHAYVEEFVIGKFVTATGFTSSLGLFQVYQLLMPCIHMTHLMVRSLFLKQIIVFTWEIRQKISS